MSLLDIERKKIKQKNVFTVTVKKKKKKKKWAAKLGFSNFNRLFSPDYASAAQILYL